MEHRACFVRKSDMGHDLRIAWRMIHSHRWFSAAVVTTLALGIGVNTMVFTLVDAVLFKPVAVRGGSRLVTISQRSLTQGDGSMRLSLPALRDYRSQASSLEAIEATSAEEGVLSERGNPPQSYSMQRATSGIFEMLHIPPVLGRGFLPGDDRPGAPPVLLLGYGVWKERYGSSLAVIGRSVRVNEQPATIIGVMPDGFKFPVNSEMWMPLAPTPKLEQRDNRALTVFAMLKPGVSAQQASVELNAIAHRLAIQYPTTDKDLTVLVETFHQHYNGGSVRVIFLLMLAAVGFVLLVACANVANMMLSRALGRQREMSIRTALGASRWRVVRQLLIESVLLSVLGGMLGLGLAMMGVHWFDLSTRIVRPYWIQFTMDYPVFGYFAGLCIASGLLFGIAPALHSSRVELNEVLKEGARSVGKHRGGRFSSVLVVFQFAVTLVLLSGAGIFVHSLLQNLSANRSVPARQLMTARIDFPEDRYNDTDSRQRFYDQLLPRLRALPGVTHVAIVSSLPGLGSGRREVEIEHSVVDVKAKRPQAALIAQSPGYFDAIHLPLLLGRDFDDTDGTANHKSAILTRECADHFWPGQTAIGKRFRFYDDDKKPGDWITVVGVTANLVQDLNEKDPRPLLFVPFRQEGWNGMALVVESSVDPAAGVRAAVQNLDQELPLREVSMLTEAVEQREWFLQVITKVFLGFALIALLMASVGLYAVIAHATGSRTQEIGVRMALGANTHNIMMLVMKRGLWQIAAGLALGIGAAFPVTRFMASLPLGVSPSDPAVFVVVALVLATVGLFACWLPARKAAALDPVKAIRYE
jgi:putative ABC transport system permease protein